MHHSPNKYNQREKTNTHTKHIHENSEIINICVVKSKKNRNKLYTLPSDNNTSTNKHNTHT